MYGQKKATKEILDDFKKYFNPYSSFQKASWRNLCQQYSLPEDFIREYKDFIDWDVVTATQDDMSIDFVREFKSNLPNLVIWDDMYQEKREEVELWNEVLEEEQRKNGAEVEGFGSEVFRF